MMSETGKGFMRFRRFPLVGILALAVVGAGCQKDSTSARAANVSGDRKPRPVRVVPAVEGRLPRTVSVTGTLAADEEVIASFKVDGRVSRIPVDIGSRIRAGQAIANLDPTDYRIRVEQAEAALRQVRAALGLPPGGGGEKVDPEKTGQVREARAVLEEARLNKERMAQLLKDDFISKSEYDSAVSRFQVAEARHQAAVEDVMNRLELLAERRSSVALARQQLADTVMLSPIDGAVRERRTSVGVFLVAGTPVIGLVRIHPLRLRVAVPDREAAAIRIGQAVRVRPEGETVDRPGRVARISPSIQEQNRTLIVETEVSNRDGRLRPGSFARAEIVVEAARPAILAPASSVVTFAGVEKVFSVKDGKAVEKRVRTGRRAGDRVEILEGLAAGEPVVVEPGTLAGGQAVTLKP
jgi:RND family efflux transporter MFP subunit